MNSLIKAFRAGQVTRYSPRPEVNKLGQTTADHTGGMLSLLYALNKNPSPRLIKAIVKHDQPELFGGDLPYEFKRAYPDITKQHEEASNALYGEEPVTLTIEDQKWLTMLDRLEPYLYVLTYAPQLLEEPSWKGLREGVIKQARDLGVYKDDLKALLETEKEPTKNDHEDVIDAATRRLELFDKVMADKGVLDMVRRELDRIYPEPDYSGSIIARTLGGSASSLEVCVGSASEASAARISAENFSAFDTPSHTAKPATRAEQLQAALGKPSKGQPEATHIDATQLGRSIRDQVEQRRLNRAIR